jgi:hypothetical protein
LTPGVPQASAGENSEYPIDVDGGGDILQGYFPQFLDLDVRLVPYLIPHGTRDADSPRPRQRFDSRRDVDSIPDQVISLADNVANMNADPEQDSFLGLPRRIALRDRGLNFDRAAHGLNRAREFDHESVPQGLHLTSPSGREDRSEEGPMLFQQAKGCGLVLLRELREPDDVGKHDRREPAIGGGARRCARPDVLEAHSTQEGEEAGVGPQRVESGLDANPHEPAGSFLVGSFEPRDRFVAFGEPDVNQRKLIRRDVAGV